jgi:O-antigen/teichoic acid export membrane protein
LFGRLLQSWFHFESRWPFVVLALTVLVSVPFYIRGAFLRGRQRFGMVSAGNIVGSAGKLLLSAALVGLGLGTAGAIGGLLLAQVVACLLILWWAGRLGLDATTAGLYAGVAAVARILFFLSASIPQVLISRVRVRDGTQNQHLLGKSLLLLLGLNLPILVAIIVAPSQILRVMMGETYTHLANVLPILSISICIVSVINLLAAYYLALRRFGIAVLTVVGAGLTYLFIFLHHGSPMAIVESLLLGSAATIISIGVWILTERRCRAT